MSFPFAGFRAAAILPVAMMVALAGCAIEDKRLADDKKSCLAMGHSPGSAVFDLCMQDLNARRCGESRGRQAVTTHQGTRDCTRL